MKTKNIPSDIKTKSLNEAKLEISEILERKNVISLEIIRNYREISQFINIVLKFSGNFIIFSFSKVILELLTRFHGERYLDL